MLVAVITKRLCDSDAEYVDVIHTDSGILGIPIPIGQSDFYPNGGRALQPGCQQSSLIDLNQISKFQMSVERKNGMRRNT